MRRGHRQRWPPVPARPAVARRHRSPDAAARTQPEAAESAPSLAGGPGHRASRPGKTARRNGCWRPGRTRSPRSGCRPKAASRRSSASGSPGALVSPLAPIVVNGVVFAASSGEFRGGERVDDGRARGERSTPAVLYALDGATAARSSGRAARRSPRSHAPACLPAAGRVYVVTYDDSAVRVRHPDGALIDADPFSTPVHRALQPRLGPAVAAFAMLALPSPATAQLPEGAGRAETVKVCGTCHPAERGASVRLTRDGWEDVITKMVRSRREGYRRGARGRPRVPLDTLQGQGAVPLNLNRATSVELESIAGFLRKESAAWMAWRAKHPCTALDDLRAVPGVDFKKIDTRREHLVCF